jgi:hypothetical protein
VRAFRASGRSFPGTIPQKGLPIGRFRGEDVGHSVVRFHVSRVYPRTTDVAQIRPLSTSSQAVHDGAPLQRDLARVVKDVRVAFHEERLNPVTERDPVFPVSRKRGVPDHPVRRSFPLSVSAKCSHQPGMRTPMRMIDPETAIPISPSAG